MQRTTTFLNEPARPGKRLALFFDGTWNIPGSNTNVWRLSLMLGDEGSDGVPQLKFYDSGVGTHWYDVITGGAFGAGLSDNIRDGYRWLMENYEDGDEIFLFGFSRGAFTARSLAGLISRCGLLKPDAPMSFVQLYERYMKGDLVKPIYRLRYLRDVEHQKEFDFEERVLLDHTYYRRNFIKMVGVWDTVGSLGVPFGHIPGFSRHTLRFHNTHLSTTVQNSFQALALDEYRKPYWAVLWTQFIPDKPESAQPAEVDERMVEQRWFSGAHANVGGGYRNDLLPQRPLSWIQTKAKGCGLSFRSEIKLEGSEDLHFEPRNSYSEFLGGLWKVMTLSKRYVRWVMSPPVHKQPALKATRRIESGLVHTVNERIDLSVILRCQMYKGYRPLGLQEWARRKGMDLEDVIQSPAKYPALWASVTKPGIETPG
jgi:uncharacterized protein (DUF2235 family)